MLNLNNHWETQRYHYIPIETAEIKDWPHQIWQGMEEWKLFWNTAGTNVKQLHFGK